VKIFYDDPLDQSDNFNSRMMTDIGGNAYRVENIPQGDIFPLGGAYANGHKVRWHISAEISSAIKHYAMIPQLS